MFGDGSFLGWKFYIIFCFLNFLVYFDFNCIYMGDVWIIVLNVFGFFYVILIYGGNGCILMDFWWIDWDNFWIKYVN